MIFLVLLTLSASVPPAIAQDSLAPAGAGVRWLPREQWVTHHWLPYEEGRLLRVLRLSHHDLLRWLRDDRRHVSTLLRARGLRVDAVVDYLVEPWAGRVDPLRYAWLSDRATRTLTQGHLAQHVFFHYLHQSEIMAHAAEVFGASPAEYHRLRAVGYTPAEIGALHGRSRPWIAHAIAGVCLLSARAGVAAGETSQRQAMRFVARQRSAIPHYLDQVLHQERRRTLDLHATATGGEPSRAALHRLRAGRPRVAALLARDGHADDASLVMRPVYGNFTVWPPTTLPGLFESEVV